MWISQETRWLSPNNKKKVLKYELQEFANIKNIIAKPNDRSHLEDNSNCDDTNKEVILRDSFEYILLIRFSGVELVENLKFKKKI